jgi:hypothetical protein
MSVLRGTTGYIATVFIQDSSKTDGSGLTGLTASSSGLMAGYRSQGHAGGFAEFTLSAGTLGTWSAGGFVEVDPTNAPGVYEIGIPNAALATGAYGDIFLRGAANMVPLADKIELVGYNPQDAFLGIVDAPMAEAYYSQTDSTTWTIRRMMFSKLRHLFSRSVSGTTETIYKMDNTTTAHTITLDSPTSPTSAKQAT